MNVLKDRAADPGIFTPEPDDEKIICRCEEIRKGEIRRAVYEGMYTMTEIKRYLRAGMGLCQGQTCGKLVRGLLAKELGVSPLDLELPMARPPVRPTKMHVLADETRGEETL